MRHLTADEINVFASRKGAKRQAVENFLMSVTVNEDWRTACDNASMDASSYGWNMATHNAIIAGINLAFER